MHLSMHESKTDKFGNNLENLKEEINNLNSDKVSEEKEDELE